MKIVSSELEFKTTEQTDIIDISHEVQKGVPVKSFKNLTQLCIILSLKI